MFFLQLLIIPMLYFIEGFIKGIKYTLSYQLMPVVESISLSACFVWLITKFLLLLRVMSAHKAEYVNYFDMVRICYLWNHLRKELVYNIAL